MKLKIFYLEWPGDGAFDCDICYINSASLLLLPLLPLQLQSSMQ